MSDGANPVAQGIPGRASILSDIEILARLVDPDDTECIFVSPLIRPAAQIGPSSLDLRLGFDLVGTRTLQETHIDLAGPEARMVLAEQKPRYFEKQRLDPDGNFVLHSGAFLLASTLEFIRLPRDIAGRLEGRSSLGRLGLQVHATAGFVDPGFEGTLTFELINSGKLPVRVFPGIRLGQICFFYVPEVQVPYGKKTFRKYVHSLGVELTGIDKDPEIFGVEWCYHLKEKLNFPFTAECIKERPISLLRKGDEVEVIAMAPEGECRHEMFVRVRSEKLRLGPTDKTDQDTKSEKLELAVPLSQLEPTRETHEETKQAVAEWHNWVAQGYEL